MLKLFFLASLSALIFVVCAVAIVVVTSKYTFFPQHFATVNAIRKISWVDHKCQRVRFLFSYRQASRLFLVSMVDSSCACVFLFVCFICFCRQFLTLFAMIDHWFASCCLSFFTKYLFYLVNFSRYPTSHLATLLPLALLSRRLRVCAVLAFAPALVLVAYSLW